MKDTIAVYALWRDSQSHIQRTLNQFEDLESLDFDFEYYFYENDSKDDTVLILKDWLKNRKHKFKHENIGAKKFGRVINKERMQFLCECRNKCKDLLKETTAKFTILVDSDTIFNKENLQKHLESIKTLPNCVLSTPNIRQNIPDFMTEKTHDSYYDVYPFIDISLKTGLYFTDCPSRRYEDKLNWFVGKPIEVFSAFGGFALVKTEILKKVKWSTDGKCDHVNFCKEINKYGSIYLDPQNKVNVDIDLSQYDLNDMKKTAKQQLNSIVAPIEGEIFLKE